MAAKVDNAFLQDGYQVAGRWSLVAGRWSLVAVWLVAG